MDDATAPTVAVVGAGASGTLAAAHLADAAPAHGLAFDILLIDPRCPGHGIAYSTTDPRHRLNVRAQDMSAWPTDPTHFHRWLRHHVQPDFPATGFPSRSDYGQYLAHVLGAVTASRSARLHHLALRATDIRPHGDALRVTLADGTARTVDAVVLALGHPPPSTSWAPEALRRSPSFVADPWEPADCRPHPTAGDEIVLVGTGLTAIDMAMRWSAASVRIHLTSRHGMLPLPHAEHPAPCTVIELPGRTLDLHDIRRLVFDAIRAADGAWRGVVDGLRPLTNDLWQQLPEQQRRRFLASDVRRWDRLRHRLAPEAWEWMKQRQRDGSLIVHTGGIFDATPIDHRIRVRFGDGASAVATAVVNCTGPDSRPATSSDPLVRTLLTSGLARPGPLDLGFAVHEDGRLRTRSESSINLWAIGPLRRGELWETVAIPEIRGQAAKLARAVLNTLPHASPAADEPPEVAKSQARPFPNLASPLTA